MNTVLYTFARVNLLVLGGWFSVMLLLGCIGTWVDTTSKIVATPMVFGLGWLVTGAVQMYKRHRRKSVHGAVEIIWDEREEAVYYKALAWGFGASWIALVLAVGWFIKSYTTHGPEEITMVSLSVILGLCFSVLVLFFSLSVIVQKHGEEAEDG